PGVPTPLPGTSPALSPAAACGTIAAQLPSFSPAPASGTSGTEDIGSPLPKPPALSAVPVPRLPHAAGPFQNFLPPLAPGASVGLQQSSSCVVGGTTYFKAPGPPSSFDFLAPQSPPLSSFHPLFAPLPSLPPAHVMQPFAGDPSPFPPLYNPAFNGGNGLSAPASGLMPMSARSASLGGPFDATGGAVNNSMHFPAHGGPPG
ncbi:unnamed protein product, partial [Amoebophrya sp. A25]